MAISVTIPAQSVDVPDPGPVAGASITALSLQVQAIQKQLANQSTAPASNIFTNRIHQPYSQTNAYNEHQWNDEWGNVTFQILGHGSVYVVDPTDPSGNGRGEAEVWVNAVRDPNDPATYPFWRKKIGYNHAILMLNDSIIAIRSASGKLFGIAIDDTGKVFGVPRKDLPLPAPITGPGYSTK